MGKFKEYLEEMSVAGYGDWSPSKEMIGTMSALIIKKKWTEVKIFKTRFGDTYTLYRSPSKNMYIAGNFVKTTKEDIFEVVFEIEMKEHKSIANTFKIKNRLMNVDGVRVHIDKHGFGIATEVYKILVQNEKITILGDEKQYFGARKLWSRLSKSLDVTVDIINIDTDEYLEKNVVLHHGSDDWEFDNRVWSYDVDKKHVRLILKDL